MTVGQTSMLADESQQTADERFASLLRLVGDLVIIRNKEGVCLRVNDGFVRMMGYSREEVVGRPFDELRLWADEGDRRQALAMLENEGIVRAFQAQLRRKNGQTFWAECSMVEIEMDGQPCILGLATDISQRKQAEADLAERLRIQEDRDRLLEREQAARAAAEAANRAKDQFLAILSHELRTPLTPVLAAVDLLQRHVQLSGETPHLVSIIRRNIESELRLINGLLDLTRINSGRLELTLDAVDVHAVIHEALRQFENDREAKRLRVSLDLAPRRPIVRADRGRLTQVFSNLIGNAIKFTPGEGQVTIRTRIESGTVSVQVEDTGIGMGAETMNRVFQAFEQGEKSLTRRFGGLGLGLTLARSLVELQGGRLTGRSPGHDLGACFTVELPLAPAAPVEETAGEQPQKALSILLVEDNEDTLRLLTRLLKSCGHDVVTAKSADSAMAAAALSHFDVLVSDIGLPDRSGWELMRQLRAQAPVQGIALSGFGSEEDMQRSRESGFMAHLVKPVNIQKLEELIQQAAA